jgi:DNA-directed RNA polymerase subunit delta
MADETRLVALDEETLQEMSLIEVAYEILKSYNQPMYYRDILKEVARLKGLSEQQALAVIAQLYTEVNIDGRFVCLGNNVWALKRWYPVDQVMDKATGKRLRKSLDGFYDEEDEDEEELFEDEEELEDLIIEEEIDEFLSPEEEVEPVFEEEELEETEPDEISFEEEEEREVFDEDEDEY